MKYFMKLTIGAMLLCGLMVSSVMANIKVIFVTAESGLGDQSFNDMIHEGLKKAKADLDIDFVVIQPRGISDFQSSLIRAAGQKPDLVIGATFDMIEAMQTTANNFPEQKFAMLDIGSDPIAANVQGGVAKDWEGSFLVGAIAALTSKTGKIGFVGGKDIPVIHRFFNGYYYGAKLARPDVEVFERYTGSFTDPAAGKEYTLALVNSGADITYHAAALTGAGVIDGAKSSNTYAIGVDINQNDMAPGSVLTSMMKRMDVLAYDAIKSVIDGTFEGGVNKQYGIKEGGVEAAMDEHNQGLISDETLARLEDLKQKVMDGEIIVPNYIDLDPAATQMGQPPIDRPASAN